MRFLSIIFLSLLLVGCFAIKDGPPRYDVDVSTIPNAKPKVEPRSARGNPSSYRALGQRYYVLKSSRGFHEQGIASWYGTKFHAQSTSSGEPYNMYGMTAAHKSLPIPTYLRVTNLENHRQIIVKVNDRGPFANDRIIDLSYVAAKKLGMLRKGTALVAIEAIDPRAKQPVLTKPKAKHKPEIYVQIGAFSDLKRAKQRANQVKTLVSSPIHIRQFMPSNTYKVQIGPIASVAKTDRISAVLRRNGIKLPFVVVL